MHIHNNITIKEKIDDFVVEEVHCEPEHLTSDQSKATHTILTLTKRGYTTFEALRLLAEALSLDVKQTSCLGLKDEDGVTTQIISVATVLTDQDITSLAAKCNNNDSTRLIELVVYGYSTQPLTVKRLHGNLFSVRLRHFTKAEAEHLYASLQKNSTLTFLNYYDQQRFGLPGGPYKTHLLGKALVDNDIKLATKYYYESGNAALDGLQDKEMSPDVLEHINPRKKDFFVSAYTSYLWNNAVSDAVETQGEDVRELTIFEDYNLYTCAQPQVTPNYFVDGYAVDDEGVISTYSKGRNTLISTNVFAEVPTAGSKTDDFSVVLRFFLPMGCYATMAVKQLLATRLPL